MDGSDARATAGEDAEDGALKAQTLVVKIASRCNLNCSYCYVYNRGDDTWKSQPAVMPAAVVSALMRRIKSHSLRHGLPCFGLVLHGGEPLLSGKEFFRSFVAEAQRVLSPEVEPYIYVQTNGTLLDADWCRLLLDLGVRVGVSLDGTAAINDRFRVDHAGRGSYAAVLAGIEAFRAVAGRTPGLLSVIDPQSDPIECYQHFRSLGAHSVDFLFPEATYERPPAGLRRGQTPIADWLIPLFDRWFHDSPQPMNIRLFRQIVSVLCGQVGNSEMAGRERSEILVVDCDGSIEPIDALKVCGNGFTKVGANVLSDELDDALSIPLAQQYHLAKETLCATCQSCRIRDVCGGGQFAHRYSRAGGFDNPSVYCHDLMKLIAHIHSRVAAALPPRLHDWLSLGGADHKQLLASAAATAPGRVSLPVLANLAR